MPKRAVRWIGKVLSFAEFGSEVIVAASEADLEDFTSPTIIRIRGRLTIKLNASDGITYQATTFRMGLIVAHKSIAGVDLSVDDLGNPWLWYSSGIVWQPTTALQYWNGSAAVSYNAALGANTRKETLDIDVSSMRKVRENERLILVVNRTAAAGAPDSPEIYGHIRVLVKE